MEVSAKWIIHTAYFGHNRVKEKYIYNTGKTLLASLPYSTITPLQRVINTTMRLVYSLRPRDHVTDATMESHWLPIHVWIRYKPHLLVHQTLNGQSPNYVAKLLQPVIRLSMSHSSLWSADESTLLIPDITEVWRVGFQCCWSHSLEQPSPRHPVNDQHPSYQEET